MSLVSREDALRCYQISEEDAFPRSVYLHVPFCRHRCGYCDFTLLAGSQSPVDEWLAALENELKVPSPRLHADTLFVGGGTPNHLADRQLGAFFDLLLRYVTVAENAEFTVEANPDQLTLSQLSMMRDAGVTRLSLGVQSFQAGELRLLERTHSPQQAVRAIETAAAVIPNISIDLIFGVPGQTAQSWQESLAQAVELPIRHVSAYGLTYEPGTQFTARLHKGLLSAADEETERCMYQQAQKSLTDAGFEQYEISNFAQVGFGCRHNLGCWHQQPYHAFGPGAARDVGGIRSCNSRNVREWIRCWLNDEPCVAEAEVLSPEERSREFFLLGLRRREGICRDDYRRRFGIDVTNPEPERLTAHLQAGLLELTDTHLRLTPDGILLADTVIGDFL